MYHNVRLYVLIEHKSPDQKLVNMTGSTVQLAIEDPVNKTTAYSLAVAFTDIAKGLGTVTIDTATVNSLEQRIYKLTLKRVLVSDSSESPLYVDDNFGVPLDLDVRPAYYSTTEPAPFLNEVVIDSGLLP